MRPTRAQLSMSFRLQRQPGYKPHHPAAQAAGLLALLTFIASPLMSESRLGTLKALMVAWFTTFLGVFGWHRQAATTPVAQAPAVVEPAPEDALRPGLIMPTLNQAPAARHVRARAVPNTMVLQPTAVPRRYSYHFEGKAVRKGVPCPNASVLVRLTSSQGTKTAGTVTDNEGHYAMDISIDAADNEAVDWNMEAYTPEFRKLQLTGRRIMTTEEMLITVQKPLEFASARLP